MKCTRADCSSQEDPPSPAKRNIVHAARKDADTHFKLTDESSPAPEKPLHRQKGMGLYRDPLAADDGFTKENVEPRKGAPRGDMDQHWAFGTPQMDKKIYKTAGDGMGGRSGARSWGLGDDSDPEINGEAANRRRGRGGRRQAEAGAADF